MLHSSRGSPSAVHAATVVKQTASWLQGPAREAVGSWQSAHTAQYAARHAALTRHLGTPHLLQTGLCTGSKGKVFAAQSRLTARQKADCCALACEALSRAPSHLEELTHKQHTQLQLDDLLCSAAGRGVLSLFQQSALRPFTRPGMHVAAFEVVFSQHNTRPKPAYKGFTIANKLGCHHQDLREEEPWFERGACHDLPGSLRLVFDISPEGERWFEFKLLRYGPHGLWLDEKPLLKVCSDLVAFDRLAAGSRGFFSPGGSWIFHARRSSSPEVVGVSVVADVVVTAGLEGTRDAAAYRHTPAFKYFHC